MRFSSGLLVRRALVLITLGLFITSVMNVAPNNGRQESPTENPSEDIPSYVVLLTKDTFQQAIEASPVVLIKFATPCKHNSIDQVLLDIKNFLFRVRLL